MKKYIIITPSISRYGGSKLYTKNKKEFMQSQGWEVYVFSAWNTDIRIPGLEPYENMGFPEIVKPICLYSKRFVQSKLSYMADIVGEFEECVIETHEVASTTWGEMLAEKLKAKHLMYLLAENVKSEARRFRELGKFKLDRGEFRSSHAETIMRFFEEGQYTLEQSRQYNLKCLLNIGLEDDRPSAFEDDIDSSKLVIGVFSRLDKKCIPNTFQELKKFFQNHAQIQGQVVVIGNGDNYTEKDIREAFAGVTNVEFVFTGNLTPVPTGLIHKIDLAFSLAGCATLLRQCHCVTVTIDATDYGVIGLFGINTEKNTYRAQEPFQSIESFLDENWQKIPQLKELMKQDKFIPADVNEIYQAHLDFIYLSDQEKKYFASKKMFRIGGPKTKLKRVLNCLMGDRFR